MSSSQKKQFLALPLAADELHEKHLNTAGNLTILPQGDNAVNANRPWSEKSEQLKNHGSSEFDSIVKENKIHKSTRSNLDASKTRISLMNDIAGEEREPLSEAAGARESPCLTTCPACSSNHSTCP